MGLVFFLRSVVFLSEMIRGRGKSILLREYVQHLIQITHFGSIMQCYAHMIHCDEKNVMLYYFFFFRMNIVLRGYHMYR